MKVKDRIQIAQQSNVFSITNASGKTAEIQNIKDLDDLVYAAAGEFFELTEFKLNFVSESSNHHRIDFVVCVGAGGVTSSSEVSTTVLASVVNEYLDEGVGAFELIRGGIISKVIAADKYSCFGSLRFNKKILNKINKIYLENRDQDAVPNIHLCAIVWMDDDGGNCTLTSFSQYRRHQQDIQLDKL